MGADPIRNPIPLTPEELATLTAITAGGTANFAGGYSYIYQQIRNDARFDSNTIMWFQQSRFINAGTGLASRYIRTYTQIGMRLSGVAPRDMQGISDAIGANVIQDILNSGRIPDLSRILEFDIQAAISRGVPDLAGWGGTSYYWNIADLDANGNVQYINGRVRTLGDTILASPYSTNLFINTLGLRPPA